MMTPPGRPPNPLTAGIPPMVPAQAGQAGPTSGRPPLPPQAPGPPPTSPTVGGGGGVPAGAGGPTSPGTPGQGPPGDLVAALKQAGISLPDDPSLEERDLGRRSPRGADTHIYEVVAHDIAEWLDRMPKVLAAAMRGGPKQQGPFKHPATGKQKYEIFKGKLFNDDGTPNMAGRKELLSRMNPQQYARVVHIVTREMRRNGGPE